MPAQQATAELKQKEAGGANASLSGGRKEAIGCRGSAWRGTQDKPGLPTPSRSTCGRHAWGRSDPHSHRAAVAFTNPPVPGSGRWVELPANPEAELTGYHARADSSGGRATSCGLGSLPWSTRPP